MDRSKFIGGSDAAGVLGLSRWDTPLSVWAEKTGAIIKEDIENEATELGRELEDYVARRFSKKTGKVVLPGGDTIFHPAYAFLGGSLDRLIEGESAFLECKTASAWKSKEWEGEEIPQEYIIQCHHYLMVSGLSRAYLAVLIGNQDFQIRTIERDEKLISDMLKREVEFWNEFVVPNVMPSKVTYRDTETLDLLFPMAIEGEVKELGDEANILAEQLTAAKEDSRNLDKTIEGLEDQLKRLIGEAETGQTSLYKVGWINSKWSGLDGKLLKIEMPHVHAKYYKSKPIRKFSVKPLREGENVK